MRELGIGRVLVASLHQGIADVLPTRLEFYENWLNPEGLRQGTIGLAPLAAVLSFLRMEGEAYLRVTDRAGSYAADWTFAALSPVPRSIAHALPVWLRGRVALQLWRRMVRDAYFGSRAIVRLKRGEGSIDIRPSIFCGVRETFPHPLCGFYAAAVTRFLKLLKVSGGAQVAECRGTGAARCLLAVTVDGGRDLEAEPLDVS